MKKRFVGIGLVIVFIVFYFLFSPSYQVEETIQEVAPFEKIVATGAMDVVYNSGSEYTVTIQGTQIEKTSVLVTDGILFLSRNALAKPVTIIVQSPDLTDIALQKSSFFAERMNSPKLYVDAVDAEFDVGYYGSQLSIYSQDSTGTLFGYSEELTIEQKGHSVLHALDHTSAYVVAEGSGKIEITADRQIIARNTVDVYYQNNPKIIDETNFFGSLTSLS